MDETIEYIGERYPDLSDGELQDLYAVGMRFCKPAVSYGSASLSNAEATLADADIPAQDSAGSD
jgi:hypothetical protein